MNAHRQSDLYEPPEPEYAESAGYQAYLRSQGQFTKQQRRWVLFAISVATVLVARLGCGTYRSMNFTRDVTPRLQRSLIASFEERRSACPDEACRELWPSPDSDNLIVRVTDRPNFVYLSVPFLTFEVGFEATIAGETFSGRAGMDPPEWGRGHYRRGIPYWHRRWLEFDRL